MKERRDRRLAHLITGTTVVVLLLGQALPAHADDLEDLAVGQSWRGWSDARLVVPTIGLPSINPTPTAFSRSYIDSTPGRSSAFASFYYADEILEEGVFEIGPGGGFKNPTLTRCNNPDAGRGTSGKVEEGGGGVGRKAVPARVPPQGARHGQPGPISSGPLSMSDGYTDTKSIATVGHMVSEATAHLVGIDVGDLHIGAVETPATTPWVPTLRTWSSRARPSPAPAMRLNNLLTGNSGNNVLSGLAGSDQLDGGDENDILSGGLGQASVTGGTGDDRITMLVTAVNVDIIDAGADNDTLVLREVVPGNHVAVVDLSSPTDQMVSIGGWLMPRRRSTSRTSLPRESAVQ